MRVLRQLAICALFLLPTTGAALTVAGCGNGSGDIARRALRLTSEPTLDGWIRSDGELDTRGGEPGVGDLANGQEVRTFLSFAIGEIPPGATIESAVLRFRQVFATNFILDFNPLLIEHVDYGPALDPIDFSALPLGSPATFLLNDLNLVREIDVTLLVQQDVNDGRTRSQFRLRMTAGTNGVGLSDFAAIETADNSYGTGDRPMLEVTYER